MHVALYFGSFNPIHLGHYSIAQSVLEQKLCQEVWFVVSPHNPLKSKNSLLGAKERLELVQLAIKENGQMQASDLEFSLPQPSYTYDSMQAFGLQYPSYTFSIIMGGDSFANITKWKNYEQLLKEYEIILYKRNGAHIDETLSNKLNILKVPFINISATAIRNCIKQNKTYRHLVPELIWEKLQQSDYYK
jgi:nicotinate-nucleotide adenylyltransferase